MCKWDSSLQTKRHSTDIGFYKKFKMFIQQINSSLLRICDVPWLVSCSNFHIFSVLRLLNLILICLKYRICMYIKWYIYVEGRLWFIPCTWIQLLLLWLLYSCEIIFKTRFHFHAPLRSKFKMVADFTRNLIKHPKSDEIKSRTSYRYFNMLPIWTFLLHHGKFLKSIHTQCNTPFNMYG